MPQGLKKPHKEVSKHNPNKRGPLAKRKLAVKIKNKSASTKLNESLTKNINARIEAQMIAQSEKEKKGQFRIIDASLGQAAGKRKHQKGEPKKSERKQLKALVREAHKSELQPNKI